MTFVYYNRGFRVAIEGPGDIIEAAGVKQKTEVFRENLSTMNHVLLHLALDDEEAASGIIGAKRILKLIKEEYLDEELRSAVLVGHDASTNLLVGVDSSLRLKLSVGEDRLEPPLPYVVTKVEYLEAVTGKEHSVAFECTLQDVDRFIDGLNEARKKLLSAMKTKERSK